MNMFAPTTSWDRPATARELGNDDLAKAEQGYRDEITTAFTIDLQRVSTYRSLTVPMVSGKDNRVVRQPIMEAVEDEMSYQANMELLMEVLQQSACPMVKTLREQLAKTYADRWASDCAGY